MVTPRIFRSPSPVPEAGFTWEELPSLTHVVPRRHVPADSHAVAAELVQHAQRRLQSQPPVQPVWTETVPAVLEPLQPSPPLASTRIDGLEARVIVEPDLFRHFFRGHDVA
jgi:hypothetical protein